MAPAEGRFNCLNHYWSNSLWHYIANDFQFFNGNDCAQQGRIPSKLYDVQYFTKNELTSDVLKHY